MLIKLTAFNAALGVRITEVVGTMWCAYAFAALALLSLPAAVHTHSLIIIVAWVAQTFLQLVLLSIIMVGQDVQARGVQQRIDETHDASLAEFELAKQARLDAAQERSENTRMLQELDGIVRAVHATVVGGADTTAT